MHTYIYKNPTHMYICLFCAVFVLFVTALIKV